MSGHGSPYGQFNQDQFPDAGFLSTFFENYMDGIARIFLCFFSYLLCYTKQKAVSPYNFQNDFPNNTNTVTISNLPIIINILRTTLLTSGMPE